jgi:membrane protein YqaA with SNARE-associated domain
MYLRRTTSAAASNVLGTTIKYLMNRNAVAGNNWANANVHKSWARIHRRFHGRHRVRQRSIRVVVLFLLLVASLRLIGAAVATHASLAAAAILAWRFHGATACGNAPAASTSPSFSPSPPFTACATVAAPSAPPPQQYILRTG